MVLKDFFSKSGDYSYLIMACLSFVSASAILLISNAIKRKRDKRSLIQIFLYDIQANWKNVEELKDIPITNIHHRVRFYLKGSNISFRDLPELEYEVYNTEFFEIQGLKLMQYLKPRSIRAYWNAFNLMRDAEATRKIVIGLPHDNVDLESYKSLFNELVAKFADSLIELERELVKELSIFDQLKIFKP